MWRGDAAALARLEALHARLEDGESLTAGERRELVRLEREVNQTATRALASETAQRTRTRQA